MILVFDRTYGNNTQSMTVPNANHVKTNEKEVVFAVYMVFSIQRLNLYTISWKWLIVQNRGMTKHILGSMFGIFLKKCTSYSLKTQYLHRSCRSKLYFVFLTNVSTYMAIFRQIKMMVESAHVLHTQTWGMYSSTVHHCRHCKYRLPWDLWWYTPHNLGNCYTTRCYTACVVVVLYLCVRVLPTVIFKWSPWIFITSWNMSEENKIAVIYNFFVCILILYVLCIIQWISL